MSGTPAEDRRGGDEVWKASHVPPIGQDLTDEQKLACLFRLLAADGFAEHFTGHITWQRPGETSMLVNPWGLWWREVAASDICTVDEDGALLAGRWDVTPAIHIHTELHRRRPDARVVIHNHPYYVSVLAAVGLLPELVHQNAGLFLDDLRMVDEYAGEVDSPELGRELAERIGDASVALLVSHGVIVTGETIEQAAFRAANIDRACRMAIDVRSLGLPPHIPHKGLLRGIQASMLERGSDIFFAGAVRQLIRAEPDVLN